MMKEYIDLKRRIIYRGDAYQAINDELITVSAYAIGSEYMKGVEDGMKRTLGVLAHRVKDIPADVVEVRHGRWVDSEEDGHLSICGVCNYPVDRFYKTKYCPNCGAKMDKEDT